MLLLASSPYAKRGELYSTFRKNYGRDDARVLVWKAPTEIMNPGIDPAIIAEAYTDDPEAAAAEYGAEFRSDLADFVTREVVDAVTAWGRTELPPQDGIAYTAFCDPSGGASDAMTLAIAHMSSNGVPVLDAVRESRPPFDPESVVMEFANVLKRYGIDRVVGDRYGGEWVVQRFREHGIHYEPSAQPKSEQYLNLLPLLNSGRVELLENPRLSAQLVGLERRTARSGKDSVDHSPGGHDDLINAVAGALVNLDLDRRPMLINQRAMRVNDSAVKFPSVVDVVFATMIADKNGGVATTYFGRTVANNELILLDFDTGPMTGFTLTDTISTLKAMRTKTRVRYTVYFFVQENLLHSVQELGFMAQPIPSSLIDDVAAMSLLASTHVQRGNVLISDVADEKARTHPLGGALSIRAGDDVSNPLRLSLLCSINLGLTRSH
jgi:hypothetical protein